MPGLDMQMTERIGANDGGTLDFIFSARQCVLVADGGVKRARVGPQRHYLLNEFTGRAART
jgi:hypothetical protein